MGLSDAARSVWAKSVDGEGGWLPLWQHMDDSADVAGRLFDNWLARNIVRLLSVDFDGDTARTRRVLVFLAGAHDIGKATPAFAVQHPALAQRMRERGLYMPPSKAALPDRVLAHHSVAGHHLLIAWLMQRGWARSVARTWGVVLGGHHGVPPDAESEKLANPSELPDLYGKGRWEDVQRELLERVAARSALTQVPDSLREVRLSARFQVLATAIVILADWIASNQDLFGFHHGDLPPVTENPERVRRALAELRLPRPWSPAVPKNAPADVLARRFRLPQGATPRPIQEAVHEVALDMASPGILLVEAPMGEGKTEAALVVAEIAAARWGAGGVLVALPTQATSDAMFQRVTNWLDLLDADDQHVSGSIVLGHGKARFNRLFQGMVRAGRLAEIGRDDASTRHEVVAHSWLSGRKKALLANFAVVTIDQLLFAGLRSRHLMLRHLALAGKVVVIDEVHAYDAYMNSYLTTVLSWLGAYRVPVVALSATLPSNQRRALVAAYARGEHADDPPDVTSLDGDIGYPVVTWTEDTSVRTRVVPASGRHTTVRIDTLGHGDDDLDELVALLGDLLREGGNALIVRNTVRRVLDTAQRLAHAFPGEVSTVHSRFVVADRVRKDTELLDRFGPPDRAVRRPTRHIVVASQVVEQSLDVDFDVLVTDLAPIDLVLQRLGRLHRHQRGERQQQRPGGVRAARAFIAGVDFTGPVPEFDRAAEKYVYDSYSLLRAAAVVHERRGGTITLPTDIAPLVQRAYGESTIGPDSWRDAMTAADNKRRERVDRREDKARTFQLSAPTKPGKSIVGWLSRGVGEADDEAEGQGQVRDGAPSLEVLLVCRDGSGRWHTPSWLGDGRGGLRVPHDAKPADSLAEVMAACALRLPLTFSNADAEEELWQATPAAWEESPLIYRQPVLVVDEHGWGRVQDRPVRYTPEQGLEVFDPAGE